MKCIKFLFLLGFFAVSQVGAIAQATEEKTSDYRSLGSIRVFAYDRSTGTPNPGSFAFAEYGFRFKVVSEKMTIKPQSDHPEMGLLKGESYDYYLVSFPVWENNDDRTQKYAIDAARDKEVRYWCMLEDDLNSALVQKIHLLSGWPDPQLGTIAFPIKLRFGSKKHTIAAPITDGVAKPITRPMDFSNDFTLGASMGLRWRISRTRAHHVLATMSVGITSVALDSASTRGLISASQPMKSSAMTLATGGILNFSGVQMGLTIGWDFLGKDISKRWIYHGKPWLGLGIGVQIFNQNTSEGGSSEKQQRGKGG